MRNWLLCKYPRTLGFLDCIHLTIIYRIDDPAALRQKVDEALSVYDEYVKTKDGDDEPPKPEAAKENGEKKEEK